MFAKVSICTGETRKGGALESVSGGRRSSVDAFVGLQCLV